MKPVVLHELNQLELGGAERVVLNIATGDTARTHEVLAHRDGPFRAEFERAGIKVHLLHGAYEADIFHIHTGGDPSLVANCVRLAAPVVETIHAPLRSKVARELVSVRVACSGTVRKANPDAVVVYNGIDFGRLTKMTRMDAMIALGIFAMPVVIGWVGRICRGKGLEELAMLAVATQKRLGVHVTLLMAGPVQDEPVMRDVRRTLAGHDLVTLVAPGPQNPATVFAAADVFASFAFTEAMPLTWIEALYCGVPMVLPDCDVGREFSDDGKLASLVPPNYDIASEAVSFAISANSDERRHAARQFASGFSVARMVERYSAVYEEVLRARQ